MKYEMLKEGVGYNGPTSSFKKNLKYSQIVKEFGAAIKEKGINKAYHDEYLYHESSYDEERFRIINKLAMRPNLVMKLAENSSPILFEGYVRMAPPKETELLDEGVLDAMKSVVNWINTKFANIFLRDKKRRDLVDKAAADLKENPNELQDKIADAMKRHKEIPQTNIHNIRTSVEVGKKAEQGDPHAVDNYVSSIKQPAMKNESFKHFENNLIKEAAPITAPTTDPVATLLTSIWKFIGDVPFVGMILQGILGYAAPMIISIMISQLIQRALMKSAQKQQQAQQQAH
jgi:hypothetical protein